MNEFETIGPDGKTYLHNDNWYHWRDDRLVQYPCPSGHYRFDIEIGHPRDRLEDVPVERNPHSLGGYGPHQCFYVSDNWSTIFGVHEAHRHDIDGPSHRLLVESGCSEPVWGERVRMMSTSSWIQDEPWGRNVPNKFVHFRGQFWRILKWDFLNEWTSIRDDRPIPPNPLDLWWAENHRSWSRHRRKTNPLDYYIHWIREGF